MGKYASHEEFGANAPINYREYTTKEVYLAGLSRIAPPGMKPKANRGERFEQKTDFRASVRWHRRFDEAMFGGSDVAPPGSEAKQQGMEKMIDGIRRIPQTKGC